ncbi:hypothetical protein IFM89_026628 [Coptis chinensis]|uniref:Uncharacterized protein n=1 Tax=Coptis chinensis TaxID=261450 RepID=A0A835H9B1_9MAGN|nr:hypothetical protein IFM89_026628 [Coptis chinensis]
MNLFEGLTYGHADGPFVAPVDEFEVLNLEVLFDALGSRIRKPDLPRSKENAYWQMHTNSQKYAPWGTSYYGRAHALDVDGHLSRMDGSRRTIENSSLMNNREPSPLAVHGRSSSTTMLDSPEECNSLKSYPI